MFPLSSDRHLPSVVAPTGRVDPSLHSLGSLVLERITPGSSRVEDFFWWMGERHRIYLKRKAGEPRPWTKDEVLHEFKFTNVFRELDRGTIALRRMEEDAVDQWDKSRRNKLKDWTTAGLIVWNSFWYRMFNLDQHANTLDFCDDPERLFAYIRQRYKQNKQIYTGAHMTNGGDPWTPKHEAHIPIIKAVWDEREEIAQRIYKTRSIQTAFYEMKAFRYCGPFIAYEMASDLRWNLIFEPIDMFNWANVGPGCRRGMQRLGYEPSCATMQLLWAKAKSELPSHLKKHHPLVNGEPEWPPFELREIEHCLCEFDKYERVRLGQGKTRSRYGGPKD